MTSVDVATKHARPLFQPLLGVLAARPMTYVDIRCIRTLEVGEVVGKKASGDDRRARVEAVKQEQKARDRRRNLITAIVAMSFVALILGGTAFGLTTQSNNDPANKAASELGVAVDQAGCTEVTKDKVGESGQHVDPGSPAVKYATVPPSSGAHFPAPADPSRNFYAADEGPRVEELVHNLEHGYTVAWYLPSAPSDDIDALERIATNVSANLTPKFIAAPWDSTYGAFPEGKSIALSHWGVKAGSRQFCSAPSGEVIQQFVTAHPSSSSPEPNAA